MSGKINSTNILPKTDEAYSLGSDDYKYVSVYAQNIHSSNRFYNYNPATSTIYFQTRYDIGSTSTAGSASIYLGNNIEEGTADNAYGQIVCYSNTSKYAYIRAASNMTENALIRFPSTTGTLALTSQLSSYLPLSGGTLTGELNTKNINTRNVVPETANTYGAGTAAIPFKNVYGNNVYAVMNSQSYGRLFVGTAGTTTTNGVGRLTLGNNIASGKANNASARIDFYGTNTAYTSLVPTNNTTTNVALKLPSVSGTMPVASLSGTTLTIKW